MKARTLAALLLSIVSVTSTGARAAGARLVVA